jgi:hypothetical protein
MLSSTVTSAASVSVEDNIRRYSVREVEQAKKAGTARASQQQGTYRHDQGWNIKLRSDNTERELIILS